MTTTTIIQEKKIVLRNAKGQLLPGTASISPGRPKRQVERVYLDVMQSECTPEVWADITRKAVEDALEGDRFARRFLANYIVGPPVKRLIAKVNTGIAIDTKDIDRQFVQFLAILNTIIVQTDTIDDTSTIEGELLE